jgi:hypothetical protein
MSIEKEIKSKFRNEGHKAAVNIILTGNWVLEKQKVHFDRGGLTPQQYNIQAVLWIDWCQKGSLKKLSIATINGW